MDQILLSSAKLLTTMIKNMSLLYVFLLLTFQSAAGQSSDSFSDSETLRKNSIYASAGFIPLWGAININYERMLINSSEKFLKSWWLRIGGGKWATWEIEGLHFVSTIAALTGSKNNHLELSAGITILNDNYENENSVYPAGNIGYRYQKPEGRFVFRTGFSFPETLYVSLGTSF